VVRRKAVKWASVSEGMGSRFLEGSPELKGEAWPRANPCRRRVRPRRRREGPNVSPHGTHCRIIASLYRPTGNPPIVVKPLPRLRLQGFNNLTKALSFNIYDVSFAASEEERQRYIEYIDEEYNADRLTQIPP